MLNNLFSFAFSKSIILLIGICAFIQVSNANTNIDSVEQIAVNKNLEVLEQVEAIEYLLNYYKHKKPEKHLYYCKYLGEIGKNHNADRYIAISNLEFGKNYYRKHNYDSASYFYTKAEELFKESNNQLGIKKILISQSNLEKKQDNFDNAIKLLLKADSINQLNFDEKTAISVHNNLGIISQFQKNYQSAVKYYKNMLKLTSNEKYLAVAYTNLSGSFMHLNKNDSAIYYAMKSLKTRERNGIKSGLSQLYNNLGAIYTETYDFENAEIWYNKSLIEGRKMNFIKAEITALNNLGNLEIEKNNYTKAESNLLLSEKKLEENFILKQRVFNTKLLNKLYKKLNRFDKAYKYLTINVALKDSITKIENRELSEKFQIKYETEKHKQDKLEAQINETISVEKEKRSRYLSYIFMFFSVIVASLLWFIFNKLKVIRKQKTALDSAYDKLEESKKNELAVSNLKALQSQMNPHFIFNALNSVQDLVLLKDIRNSNKYLGRFSDLIRKILLSSKEQFISLEEEVEILSLYLDLEKLRFGKEFIVDLQCNVSEEMQNQIVLPAMFIQPYIENAIKHGLFHKEGQKILKTHFNLKGNNLECVIEDNGIGQKKAEEFKIKRLHLHTGFSTEAINERIRLLNETLDKKIVLKIEDLLFENNEPAGTKITLLFPIN